MGEEHDPPHHHRNPTRPSRGLAGGLPRITAGAACRLVAEDLALGLGSEGWVMAWTVGQKAVIGRVTIVTIDRVTATGRAIVGGRRSFNPDGSERTSSWNRSKLEPMTPEIQAEMDLVTRGRDAANDVYTAITTAERWSRDTLRMRGTPDVADVEKAERLTAAIRAVLG